MANRSNPERNKALKVAQFANPKWRETKAEKNLNSRRADYSSMLNRADFRHPEAFTRPGSMQGPR